jgi:hypothetical protein
MIEVQSLPESSCLLSCVQQVRKRRTPGPGCQLCSSTDRVRLFVTLGLCKFGALLSVSMVKESLRGFGTWPNAPLAYINRQGFRQRTQYRSSSLFWMLRRYNWPASSRNAKNTRSEKITGRRFPRISCSRPEAIPDPQVD